jgi:pheromone shutdown protein TraB
MNRETASRFWQNVGDCLRRFDAPKMRLYQDGLAAGGTTGRRIVEEGSRRGSRNYQLVLHLLNLGAELQATERVALLLQEHANLRAESRQAPSPEQRQRLLEERDAYIADVIGSTLQEAELGVLFIGAGHHVLGRLAADIRVQTAKDPDKLRMYMQELLLATDSRNLDALARYVAAPVELV